MIRCVALVAALTAAPAAGQVVQQKIDPATVATKAEIAASSCPPGSAMPRAEAVQGSAGTASTCLRSDAQLPRITRAGIVNTSASTGDWSITWSTSLPAAPVTLPIPINAGNQPVICNVATSTANGASGRCWLARPLPATILTLTALVAYDLMGAPAAGITVQVLAIPRTQ